MKKSLLFLSLLTSITMVSCGSDPVDTSKVALSYGYIYKDGIHNTEELEIGYSQLKDMVEDKDSFVLLIFHNRTCSCWAHELGPTALQYMNNYHVKFYAFDNALLEGESNTFGIYTKTDNVPGICFFKNGKLIRQSIYGKLDINQRKFFRDYDEFVKYMEQNIYLPNLYYLDKQSLEDKMENTSKEFNLYVSLKGCPDCGAVDIEFTNKWIKDHSGKQVNDYLYIFDIYPYGTDNDIRDFCRLGKETNEKFGYTYTKHGYVPTFQRWKNGEVYDMITVLNDFGDLETGKVTSYFSEERIANSPILSSVNYQAYDGTTIELDQIESWGSVKQEKQLEWHLPAVELFFSTYVK